MHGFPILAGSVSPCLRGERSAEQNQFSKDPQYRRAGKEKPVGSTHHFLYICFDPPLANLGQPLTADSCLPPHGPFGRPPAAYCPQIGEGEGIHWPALDEDISAEGLLAGRRSAESDTSLSRWLKKRNGS